jgi:hypothetical protein
MKRIYDMTIAAPPSKVIEKCQKCFRNISSKPTEIFHCTLESDKIPWCISNNFCFYKKRLDSKDIAQFSSIAISKENKEKTRILLINGVAGSGKDTFINVIRERADCVVFRTSIIDPIDELCKKIGCTQKSEKERKFMSDLKVLTDGYNDFAFSQTIVNILAAIFGNPRPQIICVIAREAKDIKRFKKFFEEHGIFCKTVIVRNKKAEACIPDNIADRGVLTQEYDVSILNYGSEADLFEKTDLSFLSFNEKRKTA